MKVKHIDRLIDKTIRAIATQAKDAQHVAVAFSGGKDSLLLYHLADRALETFSLLVYQDLMEKHHRDYIKSFVAKEERKAYFYKPIQVETARDGKHLVPIYNFGDGKPLPVIMDVKEGERCAFDEINKLADGDAVIPPYWFDVTFTGTKGTDTHAINSSLNPQALCTDEFVVACPLWQWTTIDVYDALDHLGIELNPYTYSNRTKIADDSGDFLGCANCYAVSQETAYCPKAEKDIPTVLRQVC